MAGRRSRSPAQPDRRLPEDQHRDEPARLPPRQALPQADATARAAGASARLGWMTHFANADVRCRRGACAGRAAARVFDERHAAGRSTRRLSLCQLGRADRCCRRHGGDWVRPGIMLYGASPFADRSAARSGCEPAMTPASRLIAVRSWRRATRSATADVRRRPADAHRRRRLRLCRRLSAPRADRHAGAVAGSARAPSAACRWTC